MTRCTCSAVRFKSVSRSSVAFTTSAISTSRSSTFSGGEVWAVGFMIHTASEGRSEARHDFDARGGTDATGAGSYQGLNSGRGADTSRSLDAGATADHAAHERDVIYGGRAGTNAGATLHKIGARSDGKLAGKNLFIHAEQSGFDDDLQQRARGVGDLRYATDVVLNSGAVARLQCAEINDHV